MTTNTDNIDLTPEQQEANAQAAPKAPKRKKTPAAPRAKTSYPKAVAAQNKATKALDAKRAEKKAAKAPAAEKAPKVQAAPKKAAGAPRAAAVAPKKAKAPKPTAAPAAKGPTKADTIIGLLRRPGGTSSDELMAATGWQAHSLRGFMAGTIKGKLKLEPTSAKIEGRGRVYSLPPLKSAAPSPAAPAAPDDEAV